MDNLSWHEHFSKTKQNCAGNLRLIRASNKNVKVHNSNVTLGTTNLIQRLTKNFMFLGNIFHKRYKSI